MIKEPLRLEPKTGAQVKSMVLFLHGYGANAQDLIGLGFEWQALMPDTVFISPNAPQPCDMNPFNGFQWFPLTMRDPGEFWRGVNDAAPVLNQFIDRELEKYGLDESSLALVGFSQGTMMALHVGLRREKSLSGIVGYSGRLAGPEHLMSEIKQKAPVLLVHGDSDDVIPVAALDEAKTALQENSVSVQTHISQGVGHGIDQDGLRLGADFLVKSLAGN